LLQVILVGWSLYPVAGLEIVLWLVERVLRTVIWDSPPGSDGFDHLSGFGVLNCLGFVFVVVSQEWGSYNCI